MKKIIIFGAGNVGKKTITYLSGVETIKILAVCDNDSTKWGDNLMGVPIVSPNMLVDSDDYDLVFVAIANNDDVYKQCIELSHAKVVKSIDDVVAEVVYMDISSGCNAKCLYCVTGMDNRNGEREYKYTTFTRFSEVYNHLLS